MKEILFNWLILLPTLTVLHLLLQKIKPISAEKRRKIWLSLPAFFVLDSLRYFFSTYFPKFSSWFLISLLCLIIYGIVRLILPAFLLPREKEDNYHRLSLVLLVIIWLGLSILLLR